MTDERLTEEVAVVFTDSEPAHYERIELNVRCPACREMAVWVHVHSEGREPKRYEALHGTRVCAGALK